MNRYHPGEIVVVRFPFTNLEKTKQRPALVLSSVAYSRQLALVTIAMVTSKMDQPVIAGDLAIKDWIKAKLFHPSLLRLSKIATIESELVLTKLGVLTKEDHIRTSAEMKKLFKFWI